MFSPQTCLKTTPPYNYNACVSPISIINQRYYKLGIINQVMLKGVCYFSQQFNLNFSFTRSRSASKLMMCRWWGRLHGGNEPQVCRAGLMAAAEKQHMWGFIFSTWQSLVLGIRIVALFQVSETSGFKSSYKMERRLKWGSWYLTSDLYWLIAFPRAAIRGFPKLSRQQMVDRHPRYRHISVPKYKQQGQ